MRMRMRIKVKRRARQKNKEQKEQKSKQVDAVNALYLSKMFSITLILWISPLSNIYSEYILYRTNLCKVFYIFKEGYLNFTEYCKYFHRYSIILLLIILLIDSNL